MPLYNPQPLFLNEIFQRFTKLRLFKNATEGPGSSFLAYVDKTQDTVVPMDNLVASQTERLITQMESGLKAAIPYQFQPDAVLSICGDRGAEVASDMVLPFANTWIDNCTGERDAETLILGALLQNDGRDRVKITLAIKQEQEGSLGRVFDADVPLDLGKIAVLGRHEIPLLIIPNILFDRTQGTISFTDKSVFPLILEFEDYFQMVNNYNQIMRAWSYPENVIGTIENNYLQAAEMSLLLAQAVTKKDPKYKVTSARRPDRSMDSLLARLGQAPKRTASVVTVDLDRVRTVPAADEESPIGVLRRARHWVQAYQYTRRDGKLVEVPEHERWTSSSPVPAPYKPRIVTKILRPDEPKNS